jgi:hypothetical protein
MKRLQLSREKISSDLPLFDKLRSTFSDIANKYTNQRLANNGLSTLSSLKMSTNNRVTFKSDILKQKKQNYTSNDDISLSNAMESEFDDENYYNYNENESYLYNHNNNDKKTQKIRSASPRKLNNIKKRPKSKNSMITDDNSDLESIRYLFSKN